MEVKVVFYHVLYESESFGEPIEFVSSVDNDTTLQQLFDNAGQSYADLSEYYYLSGPLSFNSKYLPFIINPSGKVYWNVSYQDARVIDFISTHGIEDNMITAKIGHTQAGGPGLKSLLDIWHSIYPVIDQFGTTVGFLVALTQAGKWIHSLIGRNDTPPQAQFDLIYSKGEWNLSELSRLLDIDKEDVAKLLEVFGYSFDKNKKVFVQQPISLELREKLSRINVLDI